MYKDVKRNYEEAETYLKAALKTRKHLLPLFHPELANSYNNLGQLYHAKGNFPAAFKHMHEALKLRKHYGEFTIKVGDTYRNLANICVGNRPALEIVGFNESVMECYNASFDECLRNFGDAIPSAAELSEWTKRLFLGERQLMVARMEHFNQARERQVPDAEIAELREKLLGSISSWRMHTLSSKRPHSDSAPFRCCKFFELDPEVLKKIPVDGKYRGRKSKRILEKLPALCQGDRAMHLGLFVELYPSELLRKQPMTQNDGTRTPSEPSEVGSFTSTFRENAISRINAYLNENEIVLLLCVSRSRESLIKVESVLADFVKGLPDMDWRDQGPRISTHSNRGSVPTPAVASHRSGRSRQWRGRSREFA